MASSLLNNIKTEERSSLYFKQFKYRITFDLEAVNRTYYCNTPAEFDSRNREFANFGRPDKYEPQHVKQLHDFITWRAKYYDRRSKNNTAMVTLYYDSVRVYGNDLSMVDELEQLGFENIEIKQANPSIPTGVKLFRNEPPHRYRTYFKDKRIDEDWKKSLADFLDQYNDEIKPCDSLKYWVKNLDRFVQWRDSHLRQNYFVDYDDEGMKLILALMFGEKYLSKHYELKRR